MSPKTQNVTQKKPTLKQVTKAKVEMESVTGVHDLNDLIRGLKTVLNHSNSYIYMKDINGTYTYVNQNLQKLFGLAYTDIIGKDDSHFTDDSTFKKISTNDQRALKLGEAIELEEKHILKDTGEERTYRSVKAPIFNSNGKIIGICGISNDITEQKKIEQALRNGEERLKEAQRISQIGSWELNLIKNELVWSDEIFKIFEIDERRFHPTYENFLDVIHPKDRESVNLAYKNSLKTKQPYEITHRLLMPDGRIKWVTERCKSYFDTNGKAVKSIGTAQDVTERIKAEESARIAAAAFQTHEAIMITDADGLIISVNKAFERITGYKTDEVIGKNPRIFKSGLHNKDFYKSMWQSLANTGVWNGEVCDRHKQGNVYPKEVSITAIKNTLGETTQYVAVFNDVTDRKKAEEEIQNLAFKDVLTGLPNRRMLLDRLKFALAASTSNRHYGAVLFLDMDKFKTLNDTFGHNCGDKLLIEVANRLKLTVRGTNTVARFGGDEFVILLEKLSEDSSKASQKAANIAEMVRAVLSLPYFIEKHEYHTSPSIGIALYFASNKSVDEIVKHADIAMYQAKTSGRNSVRFFEPKMQRALETRATLEVDLHNAIHKKQFQLHYQIQIDTQKHPVGAEALIRWHHPLRGVVTPDEFITVAEESNLISEIGAWVIDVACQQLALWDKNKVTRELNLAINISPRQFMQPDFVKLLKDTIQKHNINPQKLKLELTENIALDSLDIVISRMNILREDVGVKLVLDDFGTGYSSLSYLKRLPFHELKIDQSFIRDITKDPNDAMLVKTIIDMANNFGLSVIAEGVETEDQLNFLQKNRCKTYQGYFFGKPVPLEQFEQLINKFM